MYLVRLEGGLNRAVIAVPEEIIGPDCIKRSGLDARAATSVNGQQSGIRRGLYFTGVEQTVFTGCAEKI